MAASAEPPTVLPLARWRVGAVPPRIGAQRDDDRHAAREWLPTTLPCHVHDVLVRAGRLAPLDRAAAIEAARWVDGLDWWLETEFELALADGERAWLHLERVDYLAEIWLDGERLADHAGAFAPVVLELTSHLRAPRHTLAVRLRGSDGWPEPAWRPWERAYARLARAIHPGKASLIPFHPRLGWLRPPVQAGWDFAPCLHAIGLPGEAWIETSGPVRVVTLAVGPWRFAPDGSARAEISVTVDASRAAEGVLRLAWRSLSDGGEAETLCPLALPRGSTLSTFPLTIPDARRWHPWEQGSPDRHALSVSVEVAGALSSRVERVVGLREVEATDAGWRVNGQPFFARGVNWVPADLLPGTVSRERYAGLLGAAKARGVNLLRVWGGGGPERRPFYELCDELGLMVWQEFPFACAFLDHYPRDAAFRRAVAAEAEAIVVALRHHPSILTWGAGNEFSAARNRWLVRALARATTVADGTRPMRGPSPAPGERHEWHLWHGHAPLHRLARERTTLLSEFGLQAPPSVEALARFLPAHALWPPGPAWEAHSADVTKLRLYAEDPPISGNAPGPATPLPPDSPLDYTNGMLEAFVAASQRAQALGLQIGIERMRRRKAAGAAGVILWQWNEPWPAISWALIAHDGTPKQAAEGLAAWYAPRTISLAFDRKRRWRAGDPFRAELWAINDLATPAEGCEARLFQGDAALGAWQLRMKAHSAAAVARVACPLSTDEPLRLELWQAGERALSVEYPLALPGPRRAPLGRTLYRTLAEWVMRF